MYTLSFNFTMRLKIASAPSNRGILGFSRESMDTKQSEVFGGIFHDRIAIVRDGFSSAASILPLDHSPIQ